MDERQKRIWLRELRLNGFVILHNFLPAEWVEACHAQILPILRGELAKALKGDDRAERAPKRLAFNVAEYGDLLGGPLADECYRKNPVIEELVGEYIGGADRWRRAWTQVECVWKGAPYMDWHSDQTPEETLDPDVMNTPVRITYNIPLVDFTWANGAMEILPGSHMLPRTFLLDPFRDVPNIYPARLRLQRGDALLRDGNGLHRGTPNVTDDPRPMLDQTYKLKRD